MKPIIATVAHLLGVAVLGCVLTTAAAVMVIGDRRR